MVDGSHSVWALSHIKLDIVGSLHFHLFSTFKTSTTIDNPVITEAQSFEESQAIVILSVRKLHSSCHSCIYYCAKLQTQHCAACSIMFKVLGDKCFIETNNGYSMLNLSTHQKDALRELVLHMVFFKLVITI